MEKQELLTRYQLGYCLDWITANGFKRVVIQLKKEALQHSVDIVKYMKAIYEERISQLSGEKDNLDVYVTKSNTCCIDLIVTQHISDVDAIIHFGNVCLSKPFIKNKHSDIPVLFNLCDNLYKEATYKENTAILRNHITSLREKSPSSRILIFYDANLINYAIHLDDIIEQDNLHDFVEIANLYCEQPNWDTTANFARKFTKNLADDQRIVLGQYCSRKPLDSYNCAIYLGERLSFQSILKCPSKLFKFNCYESRDIETINIQKILGKRMALVGRLKDEDELKIGVIITNPLPDIDHYMELLESYAKARKHTLYFISMIQTIDECKIGNFDLCDAFVVINSCTCSTILESLVFNRPIITDLEFKLVCGFEAEYGRVVWPGSSSHLSEDDMINKRKVSDVSLALIHMRNELLERCSQARANKWSGLDFKAVSDEGGGGGCGAGDNSGAGESLTIGEGLSGIASSYVTEPLKKVTNTNPTNPDVIGDQRKID